MDLIKLAAAAGLASLFACSRGDGPTLSLNADPMSAEFGTIRVTGLSSAALKELASKPPSQEDWRRIFPVFTQEAAEVGDRPPIGGSYTIEARGVRFRPRQPLVPGQAYRVYWYGSSNRPEHEGVVALARRLEPPSTVVAAVYPSSYRLPSNVLRFYLVFSAPMSQGFARQHVHLFEGETELPEPFVAPAVELWNPQRTRLTLLLDPGRIKRGVGPNVAVGPLLAEGRSYRLSIDPAWPDAQGRPLVAGLAKRFETTTADRLQPRMEDWRLESPANPTAPLVVRLPEPLDRALLESCLRIVDTHGEAVAGGFEVGPDELSWTFQPARPWAPGTYELRVLDTLEDVAGNSLRRAFEAPTAPGKEAPPSAERSTAFEVPSGKAGG